MFRDIVNELNANFHKTKMEMASVMINSNILINMELTNNLVLVSLGIESRLIEPLWGQMGVFKERLK